MGELARLNAIWSDGVGRWADLSTDSRVVSVEDTGHYIQVDQPELVVAELLELLPSWRPAEAPSTGFGIRVGGRRMSVYEALSR